MEKRVELARLSTGDTAYRYDKSIVLFFNGRRKVLSTSLYNGGYHEDFTAVYNRDMTQGAGMPCEKFADTYVEHMRLVSRQLGIDPARVTGMGTAAQMENAAIKSLTYEALTVTAIVTGGIETNGGRVGDPASYYKTVEKPQPGTINIILVIDADLPPGIMARALVTCTEGKTAALQELMADSRYSEGLATGSGTDQTIIVANADSNLYFEGAGKHSKLGELIGRVVIAAVKEALEKQSGLSPSRQHDLMRRLRRFGVTGDTVWEAYKKLAGEGAVIKPRFLEVLAAMTAADDFFAWGILYIHLFDEYQWKLLKAPEAQDAAEKLLGNMADRIGISPPSGWSLDDGYMQAMEELLVAAAHVMLEKEREA